MFAAYIYESAFLAFLIYAARVFFYWICGNNFNRLLLFYTKLLDGLFLQYPGGVWR
jgi:hypothetical protein